MIDPTTVRQSVDLVQVVGSRVPLTARGVEYVGLCPFHPEKSPSFSVIPLKGFCYCFGCGWNGDVIDFIMEHEGLGFKEACELLSGEKWLALPLRSGLSAVRKPSPKWLSVLPPVGLLPNSFSHYSLGNPVLTWEYRTVEDALIGFDARYEFSANGQTQKVVLTWSYGRDDGGEVDGWACRRFSRPYPLYGAQRLGDKDAQIIVVSGCKTADAAQKLFPQSVVITWPGGDRAVKWANWELLRRRSCVLVPDADDSGREAMRYLAGALLSLGCSLKLIDPEPSRARGWDLADALADNWNQEMAFSWAKGLAVPIIGDPVLSKPPLAVVDNVVDIVEAIPPSLSDDALAATFTRRHGNLVRWVEAWGQWFIFEDGYWKRDSVLQVNNLVRLTCREAANWDNGAALSEAGKRSVTSNKTMQAVERVARSAPEHAAVSDQWDADPYLLGVIGGVVDLRTGIFRLGCSEDYITRRTAISISDDARCPLWFEFLKRATDGDILLQDYLQRLCGYCLTGDTSEHVLAFFYGSGANGKSVFLDTVRSIFGDYACVANMELFEESRYERHSTEIAGLIARRLVTAQETNEGRSWDAAKIKELTSARRLSARYMRQDFFEFTPAFKLVFAGNHKPSLRAVDEAIRRRIHIVPFNARIPEHERDPNLFNKLRSEWSGILRWMVEGCLLWQRDRLAQPDAITEATAEYLGEEDSLSIWLGECCECRDNYSETVLFLYNSWSDWATKAGEFVGSKKSFSQRMVGAGFVRDRSTISRSFKGLRLRLL